MASLVDGELKGYYGKSLPDPESGALRELDLLLKKTVLPALGREFWFGLLPETGHVTSLAIVGCDLTTLPTCIGNLQALSLLYLDHNQLEFLPEWIGNLKGLQMLVINHNHLTTLPESLSQLSSLRSLDVSFNQLTYIPESIRHLKNLQQFLINGNPLLSSSNA